MSSRRFLPVPLLLVLTLGGSAGLGAASETALNPAAFAAVPAEARPLTWMHMMNGNMSADGIARDMQALADAGVGGALLFSLGRNTTRGPVGFLSPEFERVVATGAVEAKRLGLEFGLHNCDGWSSSGGPWVPIEESMKRVVWSETMVSGGNVSAALPMPMHAYGFYREIAVLAVPATAEEARCAALRPRVTIAPQGGEGWSVIDPDTTNRLELRPAKGSKDPVWIRLDYAEPFTARSIYIEHDSRHAKARLEVSDDGESFRPVGPLRGDRTGKSRWVVEQALEPVTARSFRVVFDDAPGGLGIEWVELVPWERVDGWPTLTGMGNLRGGARDRLRSPSAYVPLDSVRDLSARFNPSDGRLRAELPPGPWRVLRLGFSTTGAVNHPATDVGRGWECDKFSAAALDRHFAAYVGRLLAASNAAGPHAFRLAEIDSFEMGGQTWTDEMPALFAARAGYEVRRFLPLLAGVPLEDAPTTRAVLADFAQVYSGLMVENYFRRFAELNREHGLKSYIEPYGFGNFDELPAGGAADIPMGEFWVGDQPGTTYAPAVSAAHTYGKPVISAESFTSWADLNWKVHPWLLKSSGDRAWSQGINEFMFHRYAHQPNPHSLPGMTMDNVGSHLDGTQTWWRNAGKAWIQYLARGSHLLRQGVPHADVLMFAGEESPVEVSRRSPLPPGYNLDHVDLAVLRDRVQVREGQLVLPEGTAYRVLGLPGPMRLSLATLRRLAELVEAGAVLVGPPPAGPLGYRDLTENRASWDGLVAQLWGDGGAGWRSVGRGRVGTGLAWADAFAALKLSPDLSIAGEKAWSYQHRRIGSDDLYYFHNPTAQPVAWDVTLRASDRILERWHADDGRVERLAQVDTSPAGTRVPVTLDPYDSVFIVARPRGAADTTIAEVLETPTGANAPVWSRDGQGGVTLQATTPGEYRVRLHQGREVAATIAPLPAPLPLAGPWHVVFTDPFGVKMARDFPALTDWAEHADAAVRHFSGTAAYVTSFELPAGALTTERRAWLELGKVQIAAEVVVNGRALRTLWRPPFRLDVTSALQPGRNTLEVRVTNLWTNRLIGDAALPDETGYKVGPANAMPAWFARGEPPPGPRRTFTTFDFHSTDRTLLPSGLLGPVSLKWAAEVPLR